ncbi:hypothetical protein FQN60_015492 [Etheostoma spectabile]|uniref:Ubiquitin-like protease family profile domain-containing protein n=1 Tax=Etheostoma spectabile TaxID=54343 RepID=A0A5J5CQP7_9PERO|nr:hypothetical protein FQN60_015492 [Etheostoma spectabile]
MQSWSRSSPLDASVMSTEEMDRQQPTSPEEKKSPTLRHFTSSDPLRTYENRPNNHMRPLNKLPPKRLSEVPLTVATSSPMPNRTNYFIISHPAPSPGIVLQGRHFQHAQMPSAIRKPVQRNDFSTSQQAVEVDSIVLTCPEILEEDSLTIKRRIQQKRKPLEDCCTFPSQVKAAEPSEDVSKCQSCGCGAALLPCRQQATLPSLTPRPPIRSQPSPGPNSPQQNFYKPASNMRGPRGETLPVRITSIRGSVPPLSNGRSPLLAGTSGCCGARNPTKGKRATVQQHELNDPIVLSSDDEEEADNASTGSVNRLDSVSPRPADSAHSSPAPSGGRVEAAVKSAGCEPEELNTGFFEDYGNQPPEQFSPQIKKPKFAADKCGSIILQCRSVRVGTLRRMVTKPVVFSIDQVQLETEGTNAPAVINSVNETLCRAVGSHGTNSLLLEMQRCRGGAEHGGEGLSAGVGADQLRVVQRPETSRLVLPDDSESDEKFIVLIFENGLAMKEQVILEDILGEIGRTNNLSNFPAKLPFEEANIRLVNYNKASKQKEEKEKPVQTPPKIPPASPVNPVAMPVRTRMATRGISVTNEDLHCLNDGEFLNDVIIDFYLKYLVLEKLKKEDAQRIHVFSSFFYKRLNQRERRNAPDTTNLPVQKRKHNRVKTWTRHVDLFQKDFIFVPINESAHWYLAVICFPGLTAPVYESNPLCHSAFPSPPPGENIPDHCRPLSPDRDGLDGYSEDPSPGVPEATTEGQSEENAACTEGGPEPSNTKTALGNGQADSEQHYRSELHRISDECSEDGTLAEDTLSSDASAVASKLNVCKQPCILIMDSLRGPARSTVVKTLREYLEVEWEVRKGTQRSFGKDVMKGSSPRVPQQDNFSDCGVYILQYQRMKTKREEIKELILKIQEQQELEKRESEQLGALLRSPAGSPEEPEIKETSELLGRRPNLPISP